MRIRPCIDIHNGKVKQIVGGTLHETLLDGQSKAEENFVSGQDARYYASIYREKGLPGGHIILLNSKTAEPELYAADRQQALSALSAYPGGMQIGGGITPDSARAWLLSGASHVIVTSYVFRDGRLDMPRLQEMENTVGREHLVLDLSCRRREDGSYHVVTDRWQKWTDLEVSEETLDFLADHCNEFLIHAADVEGRRKGIERDLVQILGDWQQKRRRQFPVTYAGGIHSLSDIDLLKRESGGLLDATVGSALDLFGGNIKLDELVRAAGKQT